VHKTDEEARDRNFSARFRMELAYVRSAKDETYVQVLKSVLFGPINVGNYHFVFEVMHVYYAKESPIPPPIIVPPSLMLTLIFNPREFFLPEELLPLKKQGRDRSSSSTSALPQEFKIGESSR
nr:probable histone chaperone ASF1A [Tanacetum cinerariifolium]